MVSKVCRIKFGGSFLVGLEKLNQQVNVLKWYCQRTLSFCQTNVSYVNFMKIVNKSSFEYGAPPGVDEFRVPSGVISVFDVYVIQTTVCY